MYLQLCGLVDERGRQVVLVLQQGAHLLHLLLQRLLHLNRSLGNKEQLHDYMFNFLNHSSHLLFWLFFQLLIVSILYSSLSVMTQR